MQPWISASGQMWKIVLFFLLLLVVVANILLLVLALNNVVLARSVGELRAAFWIPASAAIAFGWLCWSVRCSRCHGHPAWYLVRAAPIGRWFIVLLTTDRCPACGERPMSAGNSQ